MSRALRLPRQRPALRIGRRTRPGAAGLTGAVPAQAGAAVLGRKAKGGCGRDAFAPSGRQMTLGRWVGPCLDRNHHPQRALGFLTERLTMVPASLRRHGRREAGLHSPRLDKGSIAPEEDGDVALAINRLCIVSYAPMRTSRSDVSQRHVALAGENLSFPPVPQAVS